MSAQRRSASSEPIRYCASVGATPVKPPLVQFCRACMSVASVPATQSASWPLKAVAVVCAVNPVISFHWALVE